MEFIMVLFVFLLPLAALVLSLIAYVNVSMYKKSILKKVAAFKRLSGEDPAHE